MSKYCLSLNMPTLINLITESKNKRKQAEIKDRHSVGQIARHINNQSMDTIKHQSTGKGENKDNNDYKIKGHKIHHSDHEINKLKTTNNQDKTNKEDNKNSANYELSKLAVKQAKDKISKDNTVKENKAQISNILTAKQSIDKTNDSDNQLLEVTDNVQAPVLERKADKLKQPTITQSSFRININSYHNQVVEALDQKIKSWKHKTPTDIEIDAELRKILLILHSKAFKHSDISEHVIKIKTEAKNQYNQFIEKYAFVLSFMLPIVSAALSPIIARIIDRIKQNKKNNTDTQETYHGSISLMNIKLRELKDKFLRNKQLNELNKASNYKQALIKFFQQQDQVDISDIINFFGLQLHDVGSNIFQ